MNNAIAAHRAWLLSSHSAAPHAGRNTANVLSSIALRKRPVDPDRIDRVVSGIVRRLESSGETEIAASIIADVEKILIEAALQKTNGRKNDAAKLLGWGRNTLTRKIKELSI